MNENYQNGTGNIFNTGNNSTIIQNFIGISAVRSFEKILAAIPPEKFFEEVVLTYIDLHGIKLEDADQILSSIDKILKLTYKNANHGNTL